jgi:inosine-uridine nucleoside N-ribohydrolase
MRPRRITRGLGALLVAAALAVGGATSAAAQQPRAGAPAAPAAGQKVIFDTDFGQLNDDSQALYMLLQAKADVLGVTTVSGNTWAAEGTAYALRQLELVHRRDIPVYQGASDPLLGSRQGRLDRDAKRFGKVDYVGAWSRERPASYRHLAQAPYRGYASTPKAQGSAVDFIVNTVKRNPHQVTLFVLGPATNVAKAVRAHPEIAPLVKQVIYMGGAYDVPGNSGPAAEFNVWFDPEASRIALNAPFPKQTIVPLDVTDTVLMRKAQYDRVAAGPDTPITREFRDLMGPEFAKDPAYETYIYDSLTSAVLLDPGLVTQASSRGVRVDTHHGLDYGRTLGYEPKLAPEHTRTARIVERVDVPAFFDLYVKEMTKPV